MRELSDLGRQTVGELAAHHGFSVEAMTVLLRAVSAGNGTMAQFNHPELGGPGQWMQGGMTMIGDMFNNALKAKVANLCAELSGRLGAEMFMPAAAPPAQGAWWPADLGVPSASGSQGGLRYACFAGTRRLAVDQGGRVTVYDTLDHWISGVAQQQGDGSALTFTSQHGPIRLEDLPILSGES